MAKEKNISAQEQLFINSFYDDAVDHIPVSLHQEITGIGRRYTNERQYARGGMKVIIVCHDEATGRLVAKAVMKETGTDADRESFLREARITAFLQHPNILPVYDIGVDGFDRPFFTMKLIEGESLEALLLSKKNGEEIPLEYLIEVYIKVNEAIAYAHSKGVIHLDIKPANIQLSDYGEVLVCDWGLAKIIDEDWVDEKFEEYSLSELHNDNKTVDGYIKGTLGYLSPEQATPGAHRDQRSDIYALGALLYEILALRKPIVGQSLKLVLKKTREGRIKSPSELLKNTPKSLEAVCMKALKTNPEDRYETVKELINDVQAYTRGFATDAEEAGFKEQFGHFIQRNANIAILCTFFLCILLTSLVYFIRNLKMGQADAKRDRDKAIETLNLLKEERKINSFYGEKFKADLFKDAEQAYLKKDYKQALAYLKFIVSDEARYLKSKILIMQDQFTEAAKLINRLRHQDAKKLMLVINILKNDTSISDRKAIHIAQSFKGDPLLLKILEKKLSKNSLNNRATIIKELLIGNSTTGKKEKFDFRETQDGLLVDLKGNKTINSLDSLSYLQPIHTLDISESGIKSLSFIKGLQVKVLIMNNTKISDLSPLIGEPLEEIRMRGTGVKNIDPLLKIKSLKLFYTGKQYPKSEIEKLPKSVKIEINPGKSKK